MIKLGILRWEDYPGLFVGPTFNHECPYKGGDRGRRDCGRGDVMMESEVMKGRKMEEGAIS